jgi:hypothetical protein
MTRMKIRVRKRISRLVVRAIFGVVALMAPGLSAPAFAAAPTATVEQGVLSGVEVGSVDEFLGVRYATPPVGDLRWRPPQPVTPGHSNWMLLSSVTTARRVRAPGGHHPRRRIACS